MSRSINALCLAVLLAIPQLALPASQADDSSMSGAEPRPRIGLVLGGGGARGAAHIGVLRELERLRIPIDAIVGTSMGAIVGGLYAAGSTPDELETVVGSLDWRDSLQDKPPRRDLPFRRKQDDALYPIKLELGLRDGEVLLPRGLIQGQRLGDVLRDLSVASAGIANFDDLTIPFRAVASDIVTGDRVVLGSGDLTRAMRASMSVPGIFAPVVIDGRTLVDGGLVGNLPVETIRDMGVDIIIAVDVEFPLYRPDQLNSAVDISAQVLTILIRKETRRQIESLNTSDILIRPDLGQFGSSNFAEIAWAIEPGQVATRANETELRKLAMTENEWLRYMANRKPGKRAAETVDFVRVKNSAPLSKRALESRLLTKVGDEIDTRLLARDAANIYGLDLYERVDYEVIDADGQTGVEFDATAKSWGPSYLRLGLALEDDFDGSTAFNLSARLTRAGVNRLGAEWRTDAQVGTEPLLVSEFYQPLSFDARYFIAPRIDLGQANINVFADESRIARYRVSDAAFGIDAGRELGRWGEFRVGVFRGAGEARLKVGNPELDNFSFESGGWFANFAVDTLDDGQIPLHGTRLNLRWQGSRPGLGADSNFDTLTGDFTAVDTWGRHSLQAGLSYSTTYGSNDQVQSFFPLGGFLRLSGLARGELAGPHAALGRLIWYRRSGETGGGIVDVPLYFGASIEAGNVWQQRSAIELDSVLISGSLFVGLDTVLGPLYLAAGFAEQGKTNFYLSLGAPPR
ncbi:MAG: patatin-like phospholipase family protein [Woeseia sp.]|nr:patatin-like phospholipase family protein [Woeseia sp.]